MKNNLLTKNIDILLIIIGILILILSALPRILMLIGILVIFVGAIFFISRRVKSFR